MKIEKFPEIIWQGQRLIWDSRQETSSTPELVFLPDEGPENSEVREALLKRKNAKFVGKLGSGVDIELPFPRRHLARLCSEALGNPSSQLKVLAVTGTNGKTTTASLMRHLCLSGGHKTAEIGTLGLSIWNPNHVSAPEQHFESGFTTPDAPTLHQIFADLLKEGVTHVCMEASSHGLEIGRLDGVNFDVGVFTNLTQDHLDFHQSMERYEASKARLFYDLLPQSSKATKWAVINVRDRAGNRMANRTPTSVRLREYYLGRSFRMTRDALDGFEVEFDGGARLSSPMVGAYNAENLVAAVEACTAINALNWAQVIRAAETFRGAKGRLERVPRSKKFVFVDYAHSPDALEKVLTTLKQHINASARLCVVFGCGGDRDKGKRPLMGEIAARLADDVILTSDNPRTEDPAKIIDEIAKGISQAQQAKVLRIEDRKAAIEKAISQMKAFDVCLIAGKGHENYQIIGKEKKSFSDLEIAEKALHQPSSSEKT